MTIENPPPAAPQSASPYTAQPAAAQPYGGPPPSYRTVRPPLSTREKRGAFWAGAVGFNVLTLGFTLVVVPLVVAAFGAFFAILFEQVARSGDELGTGFLAVRGFFASFDYGIVAIIGLVVVIVGLAIMTAALVASRSILRSHGTTRPWAVTWAGAGIAIIAYWLVGWIPTVVLQFLSGALTAAGLDGWANFGTTGLLGLLLALAVNAVIGWLAWWWMAHAFRPASAGAVTAERAQG
ncbi:MAG TPA: hypothetical protein VFS93_08380 [Terrimesophilobacter sp.]|nr:hypothetical protein [Terrimesophilobacter sp.]